MSNAIRHIFATLPPLPLHLQTGSQVQGLRKVEAPHQRLRNVDECLVHSLRYDDQSQTVTLILDHWDTIPGSMRTLVELRFGGVTSWHAGFEDLRTVQGSYVVQSLRVAAAEVELSLGLSTGDIWFCYGALTGVEIGLKLASAPGEPVRYTDLDTGGEVDFESPFADRTSPSR